MTRRPSPWLTIPLADYEEHMALPAIGQARAIADEFGRLLRLHEPRSVAVLGCSGGNGLERVSSERTTRVIGVDINPAYLAAVRSRYGQRLPGLELNLCDVQTDEVPYEPVEMVWAALLMEYVAPSKALAFVRRSLVPGGVFGCILQQPSESVPTVSPSPYGSLMPLASAIVLVAPKELEDLARREDLVLRSQRVLELPNGKTMQAQVYVARA
ncbi:MAG: class I SAM-dependent methyltransferase [Thermoanaerobaculia bacterium]